MISNLRSLLVDLRRAPGRVGCTAQTRECEFQRWGVGHVRPDCCTEHLLELLFFTEDMLERHAIAHWLDWGALLGAVRDGELIPWDPDGDFGVLESDFDSVLRLAPEVAAAGYHFEAVDGGVRICYSKPNQLHVDILAWAEEDGRLSPVASFALWPGMIGHERFPRQFVDTPETVILHGKAFVAPSPVHRFLEEHRYGPDYMTPKRPTNQSFVGRVTSPGELTPRANELLERVSTAEQRLDELSRSRFSHFRPWRLWLKSGLPIAADPRRVERLLETIPSPDMTPVVETLVSSLALLEQAIDEREHRRPAGPIRRTCRRLVRLREAAAAAAAGRPHRAGFPFGV